MTYGENQSLQWVAENDLLRIDYDPGQGMYRISVFVDGHYHDEAWFDSEIFRRETA